MNDETLFIQEENGISIDNPGSIIYVDLNATGNNDGTSWDNAYTNLQTALEASRINDRIWVARGAYFPTSNSDRDASFTIKNGVEVYGGFAGGETELSQRDWVNNQVILSGNIGDKSDNSDNSYHVVRLDDTSFLTVLDGFTIIRGQADDSSDNDGAGIYAGFSGSSATLRNLVIANNFASDSGAGAHLSSSDFNLTNVAFFNNIANNSGGGLYGNSSSGNLNNVLFANNQAAFGAGISIGRLNSSGLNLSNATIANNRSNGGGIIYVDDNAFNGSGVLVENSIFGDNNTGGGDLFVVEDDLIIVNNSLVRGGFDGAGDGVIDADPLFVNPANNNYSLQLDSPAIDAGNREAIAGVEIDLINNPRVSNDRVDLGAYEVEVAQTDAGRVFIREENGINIENPGRIIYVDLDATGNSDGTSWDNAYTNLQTALEASEISDRIWVAEGTYFPTNDGDRDISFSIKNGVEVYGGFAGGETQLAQRDIFANPVILSGNIGDRDEATDNSYHVVRLDNTSFLTTLDGVTITGGQADDSSDNDGAGIYAGFNGTSANLRNLIIANNFASDSGAGISLSSSNINLTNVALFNNTANNSGGAIYANSSTGNLSNVLLVNNQAASGGAIGFGRLNSSGLDIINSTIVNNRSNGGGIISVNDNAFNGTGVRLDNSIVGDNNTGGGNLFVVEDDLISVNNSIVRGGFDGAGEGIIDADPLFVNPANNNYSLQPESPAINAGNNQAISSISSTDLVGNPRIDGTVDLGAFEAILSSEDINNNPDNPPANNPDNPPANNPDNPPANNPDNPPANNPDNPPANNPDNPPANNPDNPPANNPDNPPANNPNPGDEEDIPEGNVVYRFLNNEVGVHFYTASEAERDSISNNLPQYTPEGGSYISAPESDSLTGVAPVYRFLNTDTGVHLYTISEVERDNISANLPNYELEGVAYYGYTEATENTTPLYRFYNPVIGAHFYTPSAAERDNILENLPDYQLEGDSGIAFHVEPLGASDTPPIETPLDPIMTPPTNTADDSAASDLATALNGLSF